MLLIRFCLNRNLLRHRLPKCFCLLNDHILDGAELFLLYQLLMGRRVPPVATGDLILQPPPLVIASRHLRDLRQPLHDLVHLRLDLFGKIAIDVFAIDLLQCVGQVTQLLLYDRVS